MKKLSKKGAEMTIGTIVIIILALIVLVVLVVGFTGGWGNMWNWLTNLINPGSTIDSVISGCMTACSTNAQNAYCNQIRNVKFGDTNKDSNGNYNCKGLEKMPGVALEPCQQYSGSECAPIKPSCKPKSCPAPADQSSDKDYACANAGCAYTAKTDTSEAKCEAKGGLCDPALTRSDCSDVKISSKSVCDWK